MITEYATTVWQNALRNADAEVMRTVPQFGGGGRGQTEGLLEYIKRADERRAAALAKWRVAKDELAKLVTK